MSSHEYKRRDFLKTAGVLTGVLAAGGLGYRQIYKIRGRNFHPDLAQDYLESITPSPDPGSLPNLILILVDDLGYGDLQALAAETPNLHRMAEEGVELSSFYASASVCSPSRAGIMTGRYPVRTLVTTPFFSTHDAMNEVLNVLGRYSYNVRGIPEDEVLLPEILQRRGYRTGLVGKWHLGGTEGHLPNERGFDTFYGALWSNDDPPYAIYRDSEVEVPAPADQNRLTHDFTIEAVDFIRQNQGSPFFLYLAHVMPHEPIHASGEYRGTTQFGIYGDAVKEVDWSVGKILDALNQLNLDRNTLVIFSSDNGPWWQGNPGYSRGRKLHFFEGSYRVPFLARWPGVIPPGTVQDGVSMNIDLFVTFLNLAGVPVPQDRVVDGADMLPLLKGDRSSVHETLFFYSTRTLAAVRHGPWKYYRRLTTDNAAYWPLKQGPFLFNLESDPNESYNLVESRPDLAAELSAMLIAFEEKMQSNLRGWR